MVHTLSPGRLSSPARHIEPLDKETPSVSMSLKDSKKEPVGKWLSKASSKTDDILGDVRIILDPLYRWGTRIKKRQRKSLEDPLWTMKNDISEYSEKTCVGTEDFAVSAMEQSPRAAEHQKSSSAPIELPTPGDYDYSLNARIVTIPLEPDLSFFLTPQKNSRHMANDPYEPQDRVPADPLPTSLPIPDEDKKGVSRVEKPHSSKGAGRNSAEGIDRLGSCDSIPCPSSPEDLSALGLGSGAFASSNLDGLHSPQGSGNQDCKIGVEDIRDIWRDLESIQSRLMQLNLNPKPISEREPDHTTCSNSSAGKNESSPQQDSVPKDDKKSDSTKNKQTPISFKINEGSGGDDEENQERKRKRPNLSPDCQTKRKFACLYHKFNPAAYGMRGDRRYLICEATGFTYISELVRHLSRTHKKHICGKCFEMFIEPSQLSNHRSDCNARLRCSQEELWSALWRAQFPGERLPESPYFELPQQGTLGASDTERLQMTIENEIGLLVSNHNPLQRNNSARSSSFFRNPEHQQGESSVRSPQGTEPKRSAEDDESFIQSSRTIEQIKYRLGAIEKQLPLIEQTLQLVLKTINTSPAAIVPFSDHEKESAYRKRPKSFHSFIAGNKQDKSFKMNLRPPESDQSDSLSWDTNELVSEPRRSAPTNSASGDSTSNGISYHEPLFAGMDDVSFLNASGSYGAHQVPGECEPLDNQETDNILDSLDFAEVDSLSLDMLDRTADDVMLGLL